MPKELTIATLILAAVVAAKAGTGCVAQAQPTAGRCISRTAVTQTTDIDGYETITTYKYFECEEFARPADRAFVGFCKLWDNPYGPTLFAERRDWRNLEFLCSSGGAL